MHQTDRVKGSNSRENLLSAFNGHTAWICARCKSGFFVCSSTRDAVTEETEEARTHRSKSSVWEKSDHMKHVHLFCSRDLMWSFILSGWHTWVIRIYVTVIVAEYSWKDLVDQVKYLRALMHIIRLKRHQALSKEQQTQMHPFPVDGGSRTRISHSSKEKKEGASIIWDQGRKTDNLSARPNYSNESKKKRKKRMTFNWPLPGNLLISSSQDDVKNYQQ